MGYAAPLALLGLLLLPILVILHMRRSRTEVAEVPSLLIWREILGEQVRAGKRLAVPRLPLLIVQALVILALVAALARPYTSGSTLSPTAFVLDDSLRMTATDVAPSRFAAARLLLDKQIAALPAGAPALIIAATAQPYVLSSGADHDALRQALSSLSPTQSGVDLAAALRLTVAALGPAPTAKIEVIRSFEDTLPAVSRLPARLSSVSIGTSTDNRSVTHLSVQCSGAAACTAFATLRNEASLSVSTQLVVAGDGVVVAKQTLQLPPRSDTGLTFPVPAGVHLLAAFLPQADILAADNAAAALVPGSRSWKVTVVGAPAATLPVTRAFSALGSVSVHVLTPSQYAAGHAPTADLLVLDGFMPEEGLPASPSLLLLNPPVLPGGQVLGQLADATISGTAQDSPLLTDVDLASLDIQSGAALGMRLPSGVRPVVWAANGPLVAAGTVSARRVVITSFDATRSNLPQLEAFPLLLRNSLQWFDDWLPSSQVAGSSLILLPPPGTTTVALRRAALTGALIAQQVLSHSSTAPIRLDFNQPGLYTVVESGAWGSRTATTAVHAGLPDAASSAPAPLVVAPSLGSAVTAEHAHTEWWLWAALIAALLILGEWFLLSTRYRS